MNWITFLDFFGTFIFAISGVLTAIDKKFDLVGALIIGYVTALGGGTLRDLFIGNLPVGWLNNRAYLIVIFIGFLIAYLFKSKIEKWRKSMFLFDTIGIGLFTILGIKTALKFNLNYESSIFLGVISASFGGVIRDVLTNEIPLIFRKEIYASACLLGGVVYMLLNQISTLENLNIMTSILVVISIRYLAIKYKWTLNIKEKRT